MQLNGEVMEQGHSPRSARRNFRIAAAILVLSTIINISPHTPGVVADAAAQDRQNRIDRHIKRYSRAEMDSAAIAGKVRTTGEFSLPTEDGILNIALIPHDVRAPQYRAEEVSADGLTRPVVPEAIHTFRGTVPGIGGSEARFTIRDDLLEGIVITPGEWYLIEPMRHYDPSSRRTEMVVYRASDIEPDSFGTCATGLHEKIGRVQDLVAPQMLEAGGSFSVAELGGSISVADVATEADYEFVSAFDGPASANNAILEIMNQVDGIYRTQLSISLRVVYQHAWVTSSDPYTSTAPSAMLNEFRTHWAENFYSLPFDLAHMWTGKDMDGSTIGIAYLGVACYARSYSFGISQKFNAAPGKYILTAHEIGHNFSASHTEQATPSQPDCSNTIMNSSVGSGTNFCSYSRSEISAHAAQYSSCLQTESGNCDINSDGQINVLDMQSLTNAVLGTAACPGNCDSNKDGSVNALDVQLQANIVLGIASCP
jgi:hypothetical protein